jgi:triphosphoribosyl-dephospho-CoA synthase
MSAAEPARDRPHLGAATLADAAVTALVEEAELTPKPGLVDGRGSGAHDDLDLPAMIRSALALRAPLERMAAAAEGQAATGGLRELLGAIGRDAESAMLAATGGSNSHRGAIWVLGLLVAGAAMDPRDATAAGVTARAAALARQGDRLATRRASHGSRACARYGVGGARAQAASGFPHVVGVGLPSLQAARRRGVGEDEARLDALLAIMCTLDDTCLLHRGGREALGAARRGAAAVLRSGGSSTVAGREALRALEASMLAHRASPGGSADLLAAVLFLDRLGEGRQWSRPGHQRWG